MCEEGLDKKLSKEQHINEILMSLLVFSMGVLYVITLAFIYKVFSSKGKFCFKNLCFMVKTASLF